MSRNVGSRVSAWRSARSSAAWLGVALATAWLSGCATLAPDLDATRLAAAMARAPNVLLGEVHDNAAQHRARADALRLRLEAGARPAIAFEQFDRERQADIDRARRAERSADRSAADDLIDAAGGSRSGWDWNLYRPFVELALAYDLPIVAANLSRADATRVSREGYGAVFDDATQRALGLDRLPDELLAEQQRSVADGHCGMLPAQVVPRLARAQVARDAAMAQAIRPYLDRGVVLLAGLGHVRRDVGVPHFLTAAERSRVISIGLVESEFARGDWRAPFDVAFVTPTQPRPDPCTSLRMPAR